MQLLIRIWFRNLKIIFVVSTGVCLFGLVFVVYAIFSIKLFISFICEISLFSTILFSFSIYLICLRVFWCCLMLAGSFLIELPHGQIMLFCCITSFMKHLFLHSFNGTLCTTFLYLSRYIISICNLSFSVLVHRRQTQTISLSLYLSLIRLKTSHTKPSSGAHTLSLYSLMATTEIHTHSLSISLSLISKSQPLPLVAANKVDSIIPRHLLLTNLRFIIGLAPFVRLGAAISQNRTAPNYFCLRSIHRPLRSENKTAAVVLKTSF